MSRSRRDKLMSIGLKFNGMYFVTPLKVACDIKIRHNEVEEMSDKAFASRCKFVTAVMQGVEQ
jgi:hypothetical protein